MGPLVATWPAPRALGLSRDSLCIHAPTTTSLPLGDPAEVSVWAADGDELVLATGRSSSCRRGGQGLSEPAMPFRARAPTRPCLRATWGRCAGADVPAGQVSHRAPQSLSTTPQPWLWFLSCSLGLPTPRRGHVMEKLVGRRQEVTGWGQDQRRADKGERLVRGGLGTRD